MKQLSKKCVTIILLINGTAKLDNLTFFKSKKTFYNEKYGSKNYQ